jgi:serine protease Do
MKKAVIAAVLALACLWLAPTAALALDFDTDEIYPSVVVVYSGDSMGSGFALGQSCLITNAHVIGNKASVYVTTYAGDRIRVRVESIDTKLDIAVLSVSSMIFTPLAAADLEECKVGDDVYTIGAPNAMAYTLTKGILSAKDRKVYGRKYLQTDAAINSGNSGGPLLTADGRVLGVNTLKMSDSEGIGLAIPITEVYAFLERQAISVDAKGEVNEAFASEPPGESVPGETLPGETAPGTAESAPGEVVTANQLLVVLLGGSVALNILLAVRWAYGESKNRKPQALPADRTAPAARIGPAAPADPAERTDFEIDLLE